ncbi:putative beta-lysine N-acetyltransferase [Niallia endozanthoxylica]|uniref:Putative beta-lysine N-acetyltransferase n=1 Tax=Niallia endozanthoxylica TaxID=2036016 RepID=A0A5J5HPE4_9BACI|nr:putative beta-lysine N-acetyltransferase [Niallia endozanthoxylica]KAA9021708.1 putative beta-lysine N-acetyltransferase [Niallia endozanthoxylica]
MEEAYVQRITNEHYYMDVFIDLYNKRLRIEDYHGDVYKIIDKAIEMSNQHKAEKLIFIGRKEHFSLLIEHAFQCEAMVDHFYRGSDAYYFTKYFTINRKKSDHWLMEDGIITNVSKLERSKMIQPIPSGYVLSKIVESDAEQLAKLYKEVFRIYPTPLHDPEYIKKTIEQGTIYFGFFFEGQIVSAASAEINTQYDNAELTDCATLSTHRKFGLMKFLLEKLEAELRNQGVFCAYSIARAQSFGMNAVLYQLGYSYRGRLINNCFIFDNLENMNMWVKDLSR